MKCPCCHKLVDTDWLAYDGYVTLHTGQKFKIHPWGVRWFNRLSQHPEGLYIAPNGKRGASVAQVEISRLRHSLHEQGAPFYIDIPVKGTSTYFLRKSKDFPCRKM